MAIVVAVAATTALPAAIPISSTAAATPSAERLPAVVPFTPTFRRCDFSSDTFVPAKGFGRGEVTVRPSGGSFAADVSLVSARPGTRYDVRLIQAPRPSAGGCGAGAPGVQAASLNTDGAGNASITLNDTAQPGFTGVWVFVSLPGEYSQTPDESYTSGFIAQI